MPSSATTATLVDRRSAGPARARTGRARCVVGLALLGLIGLGMAIGPGPGLARPSQVKATVAVEVSREYLIKAAFLYNFAKFTQWPVGSFASESATLEVCVLGEDPFGPALDTIAGKTVKNRAIVVRRVADVADADGCHVLFVSQSEEERLAEIFARLDKRPVLTIADMPDFARAGGIIALKTDTEERIRFEINIRRAGNAGLRLSSKLLSLAEITAD